MSTCRPRFAVIPLLAVLVLAAPAFGAGRPGVAALQVALRDRGLYAGAVDGAAGPATTAALRRFQRRAGLPADGVVGPGTRRALGRYGRHLLGTRQLRRGAFGWDVAAFQFLLAWHGFPSAAIDGRFGGHVERALRGFERWAGLRADGVAGAEVLAVLRRPLPSCPLALAWPLRGPVGSPFGPRGNGFHPGIDIVALEGTPVGAALGGRVVFAGWNGGYGRLVVVAHGSGVRSFYAHLSSFAVHRGERVGTGDRVGLVGASGVASGPHLHFEVRVRGAAVDPLPALG
ncbi:MAG: peptidoglycan DD-metalloendopeptidase family protein [Gaiellaceae bacterium]